MATLFVRNVSPRKILFSLLAMFPPPRSHGIGAVITSPAGFHIPFTARLCFDCTNNTADYEACIFGLEAAIDLKIKFFEVYGDSALVICQINGDWETRHPNFVPYREYVMQLIPYFDEITFNHIPREENQLADALATLSSMFKIKWGNEAPGVRIERLDEPAYCCETETIQDDKPWFYDIQRYLERQEYPEGASSVDKKTLRKWLSRRDFHGGRCY